MNTDGFNPRNLPPGNAPAGDSDQFARLFEEQQQQQQEHRAPRTGEWITGKVVAISQSHVFVDMGGKSEGLLQLEEVAGEDGAPTCGIGDEIRACVVGNDPLTGSPRLSLRLHQENDRELLREAAEFKLPVSGKVMEVNKGGFSVNVMGTRAFCPLSQMDMRRVEEPSLFVGQTLEFQVMEYAENGRNVVLSRRTLLEEAARSVLENIKIGSVVEGVVSGIRDYGAMVDLGGVEGMMHVSEISHSRVSRPGDVLDMGDQVQAKVLEVDLERGRISLSRKALEGDPWESAEDRLVPGLKLEGTVVGIETFGAFVEVLPGVTGLLHVSAIGSGFGRNIRHPRDVMESGQKIEVVIDTLDPIKRRLGLLMEEQPGDEAGAGQEGGDASAHGAVAAGDGQEGAGSPHGAATRRRRLPGDRRDAHGRGAGRGGRNAPDPEATKLMENMGRQKMGTLGDLLGKKFGDLLSAESDDQTGKKK